MGFYINNNSSKPGKKGLAILLVLSIMALVVSPLIYSKVAYAAPLTEASIRLDRMGGGIAANTSNAKILVVAKPATTATEARVTITWPTSSAFTVSGTAGDHTESVDDLPSAYQGESLTAWPGIDTATAVDGGAVTFPSGDLTVGTLYGFFITGGITNPSAGNAGTHTVTIATETSAPATIDSSQVAVETVGTNADQVTITASVPSTFSFNIQDNALALGTLSTGSVANDTMSSPILVNTNANNGWVAWIRSEGSGRALSSATTTYDIESTDAGTDPVTCSSGTDCYVVNVDSTQGTGDGTLTVASEYDGGANEGGVIPASPAYDQIAQNTAPAANDQLSLTVYVAISGLVPAATDYTDIWEVVGAGSF